MKFLIDRFKQAFGAVEDASVETFPDGLSVTLVADVERHPKYNVWGIPCRVPSRKPVLRCRST